MRNLALPPWPWGFPSKGRWGLQVLRGICSFWNSSNPSIPTSESERGRWKFTIQGLHSRCSAGDVYLHTLWAHECGRVLHSSECSLEALEDPVNASWGHWGET